MCRSSSSKRRRGVFTSATSRGEVPDGLGRHGETAEHLRGKHLITDWARDQHHVLPWSVEEEFWVTGVRLRSEVKATLASGQQLAFEVERKPMEWKDWDRRHRGYESGGVRDVWLRSPDVPDLVLDLPLTSVVLDMERESIGILVANYSSGYRHPTAEERVRVPTHFASAPLSEWDISASGALPPPLGLAEYIGDKSESARLAQLRKHRQAATKPPQAPSQQMPAVLPQQHVSSGLCEVNADEQQRIEDVIARIFGRNR